MTTKLEIETEVRGMVVGIVDHAGVTHTAVVDNWYSEVAINDLNTDDERLVHFDGFASDIEEYCERYDFQAMLGHIDTDIILESM